MVSYTVDLSPDGKLVIADVNGAKPADELKQMARRFRTLADLAERRIPAGPGRVSFIHTVFGKAKAGLEYEDLQGAREFLDAAPDTIFDIRYGTAAIDMHGTLSFSPMPWAEPLPPEALALLARLDTALSKVRLFVSDPARRERFYVMLGSYADYGLAKGNLAFAMSALAGFEAQFVQEEGPPIRKAHLIATSRVASFVLVALGLSWLLMHYRDSFFAPSLSAVLPTEKHIDVVALVTIGVCLGIVFFAFVRNLDLTFANIGNYDPAHLVPWLRFALVGILVTIVCIVMWSGLVKLEIGGLNLNGFLEDPKAAVMLGILAGYSDAYFVKVLTGVLDKVDQK